MPVAVIVRRNAAAPWKTPFAPRELEALITVMLERAGCANALCDLALLDDAGMEALHAERLGCAGPTNILAFPAVAAPRAGDCGPPPLGSLALSVDTLHRECFLYGQDEAEHCIRLLAHGLGHLLGHDHGPAMSALTDHLETAALELLLEA